MSDIFDLRDSAINAAKNSLGANWNTVANGAVPQIEALLQLTWEIEKGKGSFRSGEYESLLASQKSTFVAVLTTYEAITEEIAWQALNAAFGVIFNGVRKLL
ncbi:MAG: hypothetical protein SOI28_10340 [Rahnella inusitata]|jgi:hypothetical protein|uniref:Uncharacterized protein n=1 Tax=Rahnella inusitata TaxID=58169 RepID=A0ABX9P5S7_9GAMM|nr:hypothetical protein [Rahnella inusitata]NMC22385.1 hypothetical protein [Serratia sp. (in: enterobacteria)]QLK61355.1 hypothetical protein GE278_11505 [Enterobacteriaceae bacterium Kacie_13]RJT16370.1 hypothetical protein D5396_04500 [Rahnella inusitata]